MASPRPERVFAWLYIFACAVFIIGLYIDSYSHNFHLEDLETFFNIWHAVLYGGYALVGLVLGVWIGKRKSIPEGHRGSLVGVCIFGIGGLLDAMWHELFGFEKSIEGLISPAHLILAVGTALIFTGGARHWWATHPHRERTSFLETSPLLLSLLFFFLQITFLTQYAHYTDLDARGTWVPPEPLDFYAQAVPLLGIYLYSGVLSAILCVILQRGTLPFGSVSVLLVTQVTAMGAMRVGMDLIPAAILGGIVGDVVFSWVQKPGRRHFIPLACAITLGCYYTGVFMTILLHSGIWWSLHLWTGAPVIAAFAAYLTAIAITLSPAHVYAASPRPSLDLR